VKRRLVPIDLGGSPSLCAVAPPLREPPSADLVAAMIERYREDNPGVPLEVAFYQGGIPTQNLLEEAKGLPIRLSCHPADLTRAGARYLAEAGTEVVELEVMSFEPHVLRTCQRDYTVGRVGTMCEALNSAGIRVGLHLVPGLPGTDPSGALDDIDALCAGSPPVDFVRIWPALGFEGSLLAKWAANGTWQPWGLPIVIETIDAMMERLDEVGIPVIRVGLQPGQDIPVRAPAGPVHPNLRGEVEARRFRRRIHHAVSGQATGRHVVVCVHPKDLSWAKGTDNANARSVRTTHGLETVEFRTDPSLERGTVRLGGTGE